jgi:hypothetical protein
MRCFLNSIAKARDAMVQDITANSELFIFKLSSRSFQGGTEPLEIYGPVGIADFVKTSLRVSQYYSEQ